MLDSRNSIEQIRVILATDVVLSIRRAVPHYSLHLTRCQSPGDDVVAAADLANN